MRFRCGAAGTFTATRSSGAKAKAAQGMVWGDAHREQIIDFINAVRTGGKPLIDGRAARKPVEIILGICQSARTGQPVMLKQARHPAVP